jgi:hypothetical protein
MDEVVHNQDIQIANISGFVIMTYVLDTLIASTLLCHWSEVYVLREEPEAGADEEV